MGNFVKENGPDFFYGRDRLRFAAFRCRVELDYLALACNVVQRSWSRVER